ncbi:MAG: Hsp20/alpha crystallin family protein [Candidatus Odinarchaeia archaeon]
MDYEDESDFEEYFDKLFELIWRKFRKTYSDVWGLDEDKPSWDIENKCFEPLVHIFDEGDIIIVTADLPMVKKENIKLKADEKSLEIDAYLDRVVRFEKWGTVQKEIEFCRFHKTIPLPVEVKPEDAKAEFKKGILVVRLPKKKAAFNVNIE